MPVAARKIHMATNLTDLRNHGKVDFSKWKDKPCDRLITSAKSLYEKANTMLNEEEADEELAYVFLFRAMELWQIIMKSPEYMEDKNYFKLMYGKDILKITQMLEEYSSKLQERYAALENGTVSKAEESLRSQFKLAPNVVPKKRKEGADSSHHTSNGTKTPMMNDQKCHDDYNLIFNSDFIEKPQSDYYGENKFMKCEVFKEKVFGSILDILVIDIRPKADYEMSKISSVHSINIPGSSIKAGMSANKLGEIITEEEKRFWGQRDQYKQLVLLDWHSEPKDVIPGSALHTLHVILTKWDPDSIYKNNPAILNGGFEQFLDTYPTFTTNPKVKCPLEHTSSSFIHLSEHNIEYPMSILEEEKSVLKTTPATDNSDLTLHLNRPTIDRSNKPTKLADQMDKPLNNPDDVRTSEKNVSVIEKDIQSIANKMEEKAVAPGKPQTIEPDSEPSLPKESMPGKSVSQIPNNVPPQPVTPPRSERNKSVTNKGNGDANTYLEKTKFETPPRGGGLKRSASSPSINKLSDEKLDKSFGTPSFDRSTKPKQMSPYDYPSRSAGSDTVYLTDPNMKESFYNWWHVQGRGLTGLKNLGNLCYMNSIMQCISHTVALTRQLTRFSVTESPNGQIAKEVSTLLRTLWQGDTRTTSCRTLKLKVGALRHSFSTMEQQDSHEFLTILVDWLHEDLNQPPPILSLEGAEEATGEKAWGEFRQKNNSVVLDLFYGQLKSTVKCDQCQTQSVLFEPFSNLSIPLPSSVDDKDRTFSLQECLKLYLKGESISGWVCPKCKTERKATKKLDITRLPPVLIIHLKRFMNDMVGVGWCRKRMNMVDFPISELDMKPFTHPDSELRFHNYNLYAVSNHYGSMESGHYTAYCKNHMLNKWYKFDDQDVNEISPSDVKSSAAYILFYESSKFDSRDILD